MAQKILLMGKSGSGKTSMRSIIFANYFSHDTQRLSFTVEVEHSHVKFLNNLTFNLWDCGGQDAFMENYFASQRDHIFQHVEVLIYVIDIESKEVEKDNEYFRSCMEALIENSPDAKVFILVHKMDLVPEHCRDSVYNVKRDELAAIIATAKESFGVTKEATALIKSTTYYQTSIWDETLYRAWSSIVHALIPNIDQIEARLDNFCNLLRAEEVVLFEKATFLVIAHATSSTNNNYNSSMTAAIVPRERDPHRFEKISNIVKQYKLSCSKTQSLLSSFEVKTGEFSGYIDGFTKNTYVMVIMPDTHEADGHSIPMAAIRANIQLAKPLFEKEVAL